MGVDLPYSVSLMDVRESRDMNQQYQKLMMVTYIIQNKVNGQAFVSIVLNL